MATIQYLKTQLLLPKTAPPNDALFVLDWQNRTPRNAAIKKRGKVEAKDIGNDILINAPPPAAQVSIPFESQTNFDLDNSVKSKKGIDMLTVPTGKGKNIKAFQVDEFTGRLITGDTEVEIGNDTPLIEQPIHAPGFRIDIDKLKRSNTRSVIKKGAEKEQIPGNVYTQHELATIAAALGIQRGGKKQELVQRILDAI